MITIKSKGKTDADKVAVNGSVDKRPESGSIKLPKDVAASENSFKNGGYNRDDYRNIKSTGSYYKSNRFLMKNRSYSNEYGYTSRKYSDDGSKKRDDFSESRSVYYSSYRNGEFFVYQVYLFIYVYLIFLIYNT